MFDPLTEPLELLAKKHSLERIRSGADELRVAIQTRGFVFEKRPGPGSQAIDAFTQAWDQLSDPLLPVQGHGILTLKDPQALKNREQLLKVFIGSLEHEDSYIYLVSGSIYRRIFSVKITNFVYLVDGGSSSDGSC